MFLLKILKQHFFWTSYKNGPYTVALLEALLLPSAIAVIRCDARSSASTFVAAGNHHADAAAKARSLSPYFGPSIPTYLSLPLVPPSLQKPEDAPETEKC